MTVEQLEYLKQYEANFKTAIESNYTRSIPPSILKKMLEIYQEETGDKYNLCTHCPISKLHFLKKVGKLYFKLVQKGNEPILVINELQETVTDLENNNVKKNKKDVKHTVSKVKQKS